MRFIVSSGSLLKQLNMAGTLISSNSAMPILENFLFTLLPGKLVITSSDSESTLTTTIAVESEVEGEACVPAKILMDILKTFPEQPLTFDFGGDDNQLEISSDYGRYQIGYFGVNEYPRLPEIEDSSVSKMPSGVLATAIQKTLFASGNDDLRPVMSGVFFQLNKEGATFVSTDAHKLVRYRRVDISTAESAEFIMPKKPLTILKGILSTAEDEVQLHYNQKNCRFEFKHIVLTARLIDGRYPNYDAVIPKENPNKLTIDREAFLHSVKRVSLFANKTTHQIRLKIAGSEVQTIAEDLDFSNKAHERIQCDYDGSDMEIGFNSRFLVEMLSNLESEHVLLELSAPNRAGLLSPIDGKEIGEEVLMLVMPVMINS